jgi:hypothetical protein
MIQSALSDLVRAISHRTLATSEGWHIKTSEKRGMGENTGDKKSSSFK